MTVNPDLGGLQPPNMPNHTFDARDITPDRSGAYIGAAAGAAVSGAVDTYDSYNKDSIVNAVRNGTDQAQQVYTDSLPANLKSSTAAMQQLQTAFDQGKISDMYYTGQLAAMQKSLRSQYPQYQDFVDQATQQITGIRPANAYQAAVQDQFAKQATLQTDSVKANENWLRDNSYYTSLAAPDYFQNPSKYDPQKVLAAAVDLKNKDDGFKVQSMQDDLLDKENKLTSEQAEQSATMKSNFVVSSMLGSMSAGLGLDEGGLIQKLGDMAGKGFTSQQYAQLTEGLGKMGATLSYKLTNELNQPMNPSDPKSLSYAAVLGPDDTKKVIDGAMTQFQQLQTYATDQNWGAFSFYTRMNKLTQDQDINTMLGQSDEMRHLQAYAAISPALGQAYLQDSAKYTSIFAETAPELSARIATGNGTLSSYVEGMATSTKDATTKSEGLNALINTNLENVTSGKATPDELHNAVQGTYNAVDDKDHSVWTYIDPKDKEALYAKMYSPAVTASILKSGNQDDIKTYYNSVIDASYNLPSLQNAAAIIQNNPNTTLNTTVQFDQNTHQLTVTPGNGIAPGGFIGYRMQQSAIGQTTDAVKTINNVFRTIQPILDAEKIPPDQQGAVFQGIVKDYGIQLGKGRDSSIFDQIGQGFSNLAKGVSDAQSGVDPNKGIAQNMAATPSQTEPQHELNFITPNDTSAAPVKSAIQNSIASSGDPLKTAQAYLGKDERSAPDVQALEGFFKQSGIDIDPSKTPWCAAFVNSVLKQSGKKDNSGNLWAESFLSYGTADQSPHVGDVVVFKGHVGFVSSIDAKNGTIDVLGGNQGTSTSPKGEGDAVNIETRPLSDALAFRIPVTNQDAQ